MELAMSAKEKVAISTAVIELAKERVRTVGGFSITHSRNPKTNTFTPPGA